MSPYADGCIMIHADNQAKIGATLHGLQTFKDGLYNFTVKILNGHEPCHVRCPDGLPRPELLHGQGQNPVLQAPGVRQ